MYKQVRFVANELFNFRPWIALEELSYRIGLAKRPLPLFIVAHKRRCSTLLCHLLNTHPAVRAFGEANMGYTRSLNYRRLHSRCRKFTSKKGEVSFDVDKILHNCPGSCIQTKGEVCFSCSRAAAVADEYKKDICQLDAEVDRQRTMEICNAILLRTSKLDMRFLSETLRL